MRRVFCAPPTVEYCIARHLSGGRCGRQVVAWSRVPCRAVEVAREVVVWSTVRVAVGVLVERTRLNRAEMKSNVTVSAGAPGE